MKKAWIGIGSNLGDRLDYIRRALGLVDALPDTSLLRVSSVYDAEPVGNASQPRFLNAVAEVETAFEAREFLRELNGIEDQCGRIRREVWGPRTLDLDLLIYGDLVIESEELTVPHPRASERAFVLVPLAELEPWLVVPGIGETVTTMIGRLGDLSGKIRLAGDPPAPHPEPQSSPE
jgi:2-amino-4-hydroxy-6-hydroxymethyldihydropteridine diphosphokinase